MKGQEITRMILGTFALAYLCNLRHPEVVGQPDGDTIVSVMEANVKVIAGQAENIFGRKCALARAYQPQNCSRRECHPLENETELSSCVYFHNNTFCPIQSDGTVCNTVRANLEMSYVRVPPLNQTFGGEIGRFLGTAISTLRELDPTFRAVRTNMTRTDGDLENYFELFFGDVQGATRFYPGRELNETTCGTYDPRRRPWFIGAISVVKDIVVLIDTGSYMTKPYQAAANITTPLEGAKSIVKELMLTLTNSDRATIIPFNGSSDPILLDQQLPQFKIPSQGLGLRFQQKPPGYTTFINALDGEAFSGGDGTQPNSSNYTTGFTQALSIFNHDMPGFLKIVILLTAVDGQPSAADLATATSIFGNSLTSQSNPRLFVYGLGDDKVESNDWSNLANNTGGYNERLKLIDVIPNPLASLHAYFDFLVQSRISFYNGKNVPFWQHNYPSSSGLGNVITVSMAAITPDGKLIGAAGLNVWQLDGLLQDLNLLNEITEILTGKETSSPSANGTIITSNDGGYYSYAETWNCGNISISDDELFCPSDSEETFESLVCCPECSASDHPNLTGRRVAIALPVTFVSVFIIFAIIILSRANFFMRFKPRKAKWSGRVREFSFEDLSRATNNFHPSQVIGQGSFGKVYRGTIGDEMVAVKELSRELQDRADDFRAELRTAGLTPHPNLVELKGTCSIASDSKFFLVYELVEGGDLDSWLWPNTSAVEIGRTHYLSWTERKKIARGIASGLNYLHCGFLPKKKIFHLDIKPQNILLDGILNPKIADFGISQLYEFGHTYRIVGVESGTPGYYAPEVLQGPKPNSKLDVYSFGMVLLQLVSGIQIQDPEVMRKSGLAPWARGQVEDGHAARVIDSRLVDEVKEAQKQATLNSCLEMLGFAVRCISVDPDARPEMSVILDTIDNNSLIDRSFDDILTLDSPSYSDRTTLIANPEVTTLLEYQPVSSPSVRVICKPISKLDNLAGSGKSLWEDNHGTSCESNEAFGTPPETLNLELGRPLRLTRTRSWS